MEPNATMEGRLLPEHVHAPALHAGFWQRFAAYLIDCLVLVPAMWLLEFALFVPMAIGTTHDRANTALPWGAFVLVWALMLVVPWLYFALCESSKWQATPGKLALSLRVTDIYGRRLGFARASGRFFGKIISGIIFYIGYMMAGWTQRKQALHDMMAGTCVVRRFALAAWERGELEQPGSGVAGNGMPGWAVALIVIGACFFLIVPIFAILAAIAIPAYQDYVIRAQVAQGMTLAEGAKTAVTEYVARQGELPSDNAAVGLTEPRAIHSEYVVSIEVREGQIVVTYGNRVNSLIRDDHIVIVPQGSASMLHWACSSPDIKSKYLPQRCRD